MSLPDRIPFVRIDCIDSSRSIIQRLQNQAIPDLESIEELENPHDPRVVYTRSQETDPKGLRIVLYEMDTHTVGVAICSEEWAEGDSPAYEVYTGIARSCLKPVLKFLRTETGDKSLTLRIDTKKSLVPKIPNVTGDYFKAFVGAANTAGLHS